MNYDITVIASEIAPDEVSKVGSQLGKHTQNRPRPLIKWGSDQSVVVERAWGLLS